MDDIPGCTAVAHQFAFPCDDPSVRRFCSALFPEGPELRLCAHHDQVFYDWCIAACDERASANTRADALNRYLKISDEWRFEA